MPISIKLIHLTAILPLVTLAGACSAIMPPQAAPASPPTASVLTGYQAAPAATKSETSSPPPSIVKRLLETKECPKCGRCLIEG